MIVILGTPVLLSHHSIPYTLQCPCPLPQAIADWRLLMQGQGSSGQEEGCADADGLRQPRVAAAFLAFLSNQSTLAAPCPDTARDLLGEAQPGLCRSVWTADN